MAATADVDQSRPSLGIVLRLWLGYVVLSGLWAAYRTWTIIADLVDHHDPRWTGDMVWALPTLAGLSLLNALCAGLLLFRLKLGFYVILLSAVVSVGIVLILPVPLAGLLPGLFGLAVLVVLVNRRWAGLR